MLDVDGQFPGPGAKKISAGANVISKVKQPIKLKPFFADRIFLHIDLQALAVLLQVRKPSFAHQPNGHDPAGQADVDPRGLELLTRFARVLCENLRNGVGKIVFRRVRLLTESLNLIELLQSEFVDVFVERQKWTFVR